MNTWIILICIIVIALVVYWLLTHRFYDILEQDEIWEECTDKEVLREAIRLAELKIAEFSNSIKIIEYKATLLVTLCLAIMGYFYTIEWSYNFFELFRVAALFFLFIASLFGIRVLLSGHFSIAGINPQASLWRAKYHKSNENIDVHDTENTNPNISKLLLYTLEEYHEVIKTTRKVKYGKIKDLEIAIIFLVCGIIALSELAVVNLLRAFI